MAKGSTNASGSKKLKEELTQKISDLDEKVEEELNVIRSHVGMIVQTTTLDTEAKVKAIYGGTSWLRLDDMFLVGAGTSYGIKTTGGSVSNDHTHTLSHTHKVTASGSVSGGAVQSHTLTISEMPSHSHRAALDSGVRGSSLGIGTGSAYDYYGYQSYTESVGGGGGHSHGFTQPSFTGSEVTSGGASNETSSGASNTNNLPPYKAVYIWERTA